MPSVAVNFLSKIWQFSIFYNLILPYSCILISQKVIFEEWRAILHCSKRANDEIHVTKRVVGLSQVKRVEQQFVLERDKRSVSLKHLDRDFDTVLETPLPRALNQEYERELEIRNQQLTPRLNDPLFRHQWHLVSFNDRKK